MSILKLEVTQEIGKENDSEEREDRTTAWILAEASKWSLYGVEVKIDGMFYTGESSEVIDQCSREDNYYMEDYVSDDKGKIVQVEFNRL